MSYGVGEEWEDAVASSMAASAGWEGVDSICLWKIDRFEESAPEVASTMMIAVIVPAMTRPPSTRVSRRRAAGDGEVVFPGKSVGAVGEICGIGNGVGARSNCGIGEGGADCAAAYGDAAIGDGAGAYADGGIGEYAGGGARAYGGADIGDGAGGGAGAYAGGGAGAEEAGGIGKCSGSSVGSEIVGSGAEDGGGREGIDGGGGRSDGGGREGIGGGGGRSDSSVGSESVGSESVGSGT